MRQAVAQAVHHCAYREAFGAKLADQPLMRNVLADLAIESEAATALGLRLAAAYDAAEGGDERERALLRLAVPAAKYWVTKRCAPVAVEAAECLGGNGYVEESGMPRLVRESPLNSIWEGAGNVQALDVLRALGREPAALDAYLTEVGAARGADHRLDGAIRGLLTELADLGPPRGGRGGWWSGWRWCSRARCWCGTRRRRSPTRSARGGWAATGARPSARCRRRWIWRRWWSGRGRWPEASVVRGWCCADTAPPPPHRPVQAEYAARATWFKFGHRRLRSTRVAGGCNLLPAVCGLCPSAPGKRSL